ncbi:basic proline-rich protein-like [Canis lupus familiaris]|uniref:basic proline-rich protein-like n=1 Tax=Canis lupus familiaris TaxID=9615 RepID=UPI0018F4E81D|nr:basic proline-rich protein-like [Canis lupus familiaris]
MLTTIPPTLHSPGRPGRRPRLRTSASSPSRHRLRRLPQALPRPVPAGRSSAPSRAPPERAARRPTRATPHAALAAPAGTKRPARRLRRPPLGGALAALRLPGPRLPAGEPRPLPPAPVRDRHCAPGRTSTPVPYPPHLPRQLRTKNQSPRPYSSSRPPSPPDPPRPPPPPSRAGWRREKTARPASMAARASRRAPRRGWAAAGGGGGVGVRTPAAGCAPREGGGGGGEDRGEGGGASRSPLEAWVRIPLLTRPPFGPPNAGSPHPGLDDALSVPPYTPLAAAAGCGLRAGGALAHVARGPTQLQRLGPPGHRLGAPRAHPSPATSRALSSILIPRRPAGLGNSASRRHGSPGAPFALFLPAAAPCRPAAGRNAGKPRAGRATLPLRGAPRSPPRSPSPALHLPPARRRERGGPPRPVLSAGPHSFRGLHPLRPRGAHEAWPPGGLTTATRPPGGQPSPPRASQRRDPRPVRWAWPGGGGVGSTPPWWLRGALSARQPCLPGPPPRRKPLRGPGLQDASALPHRAARQPASRRPLRPAHLPASPPPQPSRPRRIAAGQSSHAFLWPLGLGATLGGPHLRRRHRRRHATHAHPHPPPPTPRHPGSAHNPISGPHPAPAARTARAGEPSAHGPSGGRRREGKVRAELRRPQTPPRCLGIGRGSGLAQACSSRQDSGLAAGPAPGRGRRVSRVRLGASLGPWAPRAGPSPSPSPSPSPRRICTGAEPVLQTAGPPPAPAQRVLTTGRAGTTTSAAGEAVWWPPPPVHGWFSGRILRLPRGRPGFDSRPMQRAAPFWPRAPGFLAHALKPQGLSLNQLCSRRGPCPPAPPRFPLPTCLFWSLARGRQPWPPRSTRLPAPCRPTWPRSLARPTLSLPFFSP